MGEKTTTGQRQHGRRPTHDDSTIPSSASRALAESVADSDWRLQEAYNALVGINGNLPSEWSIEPGMALEACPECGSTQIGQTWNSQYCNDCRARWPYNEPSKAYIPHGRDDQQSKEQNSSATRQWGSV